MQTGAEEGDLVVRGKGDKVRSVYLYDDAAAYLLDWLKLRGSDEGAMFLAVNTGGSTVFGLRGRHFVASVTRRWRRCWRNRGFRRGCGG